MRLATLLLAGLACACSSSMQSGDGEPAVRFEVAPDAVTRGDTVTLTLRNESTDTLGYNLCSSALERRTGDAWEPVASSRVCTMELRTLGPAARAEYRLDVPADLPAGDYRYVTGIEVMNEGSRRGVASETFRIR